ncbi:MAG: hypothetical protein ABEJ79_12265 [Halolamina sp.]
MNVDDRAAVRVAAAVGLLMVLVGIGAASGFTLAAVDQPSGEEILNDTSDRYDAADTVTIKATVRATNGTNATSWNVSAVAADGNRSRVTVEGENRSVVAGSNGTAAWTFDPTTGTTTIYRNGTVTTVGPLGNRTTRNVSDHGAANHSAANYSAENYTAPSDPAFYWDAANRSVERVDTTRYEGAEVYVVSVTHVNESVDGEARFWIRTNDSVVLKQRATTPNGTLVVEYEQTRFNVSAANSTFQPPSADDAAGLTPVDSLGDLAEETPFRALAVDGDDADGDRAVAFERGVVTALGADDGTTAVSRYADGSRTVTLVQTGAETPPVDADNASTETVTVGDRTVNVTETDDRVVVWWTTDKTTVALSGDAPRERLLDLVEAVEPATEAADDG